VRANICYLLNIDNSELFNLGKWIWHSHFPTKVRYFTLDDIGSTPQALADTMILEDVIEPEDLEETQPIEWFARLAAKIHDWCPVTAHRLTVLHEEIPSDCEMKGFEEGRRGTGWVPPYLLTGSIYEASGLESEFQLDRPALRPCPGCGLPLSGIAQGSCRWYNCVEAMA